jgi:hypothetical protein
MSKNLNISVLVAARDEYIDQLKCILVPLILQGFNSIYQDALKLSENKRTIYKFQELLKQIPQWNQTILQEESKRIKKKCPYIMDIVTAIFVTNVKILASVRLKGSKDDIRVKIPTSDIFIHGIYIESAHQIFYDPFLFYHKNNFDKIQENKYHVKSIIENSIEETIRQMLPFDDILQKYLADALNENAEFGDGSDSSENESADSDPDEESIDGEDFPSDEDYSDLEEDDPERDKVKSFNLDGKQTSFQPENELEEEEDPELENPGEPPSGNSFVSSMAGLSPLTQQIPQPQVQVPQVQVPQAPPQPQFAQGQVPQAPPQQQVPQGQQQSYSFF